MDFKRFGTLLAGLGLIALLGAIVWWFTFYQGIVQELAKAPGGHANMSVFDAIGCLYSGTGLCALIAGGANLMGKTAYEPMLFWFGLAALVAGLLVRFTAKPSSAG
jgi:hypothetical protein